ncbi:MAG: PhoX family phosphatase [Pseudomonadota bacterium]
MTLRNDFEAMFEAADDVPVERTTAPSLGVLWSRRSFLKGTGGLAILATSSTSLLALSACGREASLPPFNFTEVKRGVDEHHHVAEGHDADILIRWGDPVIAGAPAFDPANQTGAAQVMQFGYNCDYVGFVPLPYGSNATDHGLLCVNHEYTNASLMFAGFTTPEALTKDQVDVMLAAHGGSIVEIIRDKTSGKWSTVGDSTYNRRINMLETEIEISGPVAGHPRLQTQADPSGTRVIGTLNNCAGGITPWGTYLMGEENINFYFAGELKDETEAVNHKRMAVPDKKINMGWAQYHERFDVGVEPHEPNRFGWITEVDPLDPASRPKKRTALGRFKHEGAESILSKDGRLVIYMGDDQRNEYLYRFVSTNAVNLNDRAANADLLDNGTLYVACLDDKGTGIWAALTHGANGLDATNGFANQAEVLIEARRAADILKATPMDRPEDVQPNAVTGRVYVSLTNNSKRDAKDAHGANPRGDNLWGQILEIIPDKGEQTSDTFTWDLLVTCGDPKDANVHAKWNEATGNDGWFCCPDNLAVDTAGRLWVATDQGDDWKSLSGAADGIFALTTQGETRGTAKRFFQVPVGAEMCGPCFTPDSSTLFVAVQHPAADIAPEERTPPRASTYEDPATRWPDFSNDMPPRPSVVAITSHKDGSIGI